MQKKIFLTLLLPLLIIISVTPFAFGQLTNESIVVTTDKASYSEGETIVITGEVRDLYSGTPVSIMVTSALDRNDDGENDLISISQVEVGADKKFSNVLTAGGALMKYGGTYTVTVQYGTINRSATTSFYFNGEILESTPESLCGLGTYYDPIKNICVLEIDDDSYFEEIDVSTDFTNTEIEQMDDIPEWVRGIFYFWAEDLISDYELKEAIRFLVNSGVIVL